MLRIWGLPYLVDSWCVGSGVYHFLCSVCFSSYPWLFSGWDGGLGDFLENRMDNEVPCIILEVNFAQLFSFKFDESGTGL